MKELKNASDSIMRSFELAENSTFLRLRHSLNAKLPMISIKSGIVTFSIFRTQKTRTSKFSCSGFDFPIMNLSSYDE